jgi:hypothetical protein
LGYTLGDFFTSSSGHPVLSGDACWLDLMSLMSNHTPEHVLQLLLLLLCYVMLLLLTLLVLLMLTPNYFLLQFFFVVAVIFF